MEKEELEFWSRQLKQEILSRHKAGNRSWTVIPGLNLSCLTEDTINKNCFYTLSAALILQGEKCVRVGGRTYTYGAGTMVVTSVDVPTAFSIEADPEHPFLSMSLKLDPFLLAELMQQVAGEPKVQAAPDNEADAGSFLVTNSTAEILEEFAHLLKLTDSEAKRSVMLPGVLRNIHYLVLSHNAAINLRQFCDTRLPVARIARAVSWIRGHYREPISVEYLAGLSAMALSTFHQHFRNITSIAPLQYQKRLRLNEARRLMISEGRSASEAAFEVGYESVQQFNREYKRLFGAPPVRDAKQAIEGHNGH